MAAATDKVESHESPVGLKLLDVTCGGLEFLSVTAYVISVAVSP